MPRATRTNDTDTVETNGALPQRTGVNEGGIPKRVGRPRNSYAHWAPVVAELREALGESWEYGDVANVQTLTQGLRREFGLLASSRGVDKETKVGTLYIEYPSVLHDDGSRTPDEDAVTANKEKYAK
jgi:hypothetical protein